jgi:hypothetical protein
MRSSAFLTREERLWLERSEKALDRARAEGRLQPTRKRARAVDEQTELEQLRKRVAELEREPAPDQAPFRGSSVVGAVSPDAERPSFLKAAQQRSGNEQTEWLDQLASNHPDPAMRRRASEALARRGAA